MQIPPKKILFTIKKNNFYRKKVAENKCSFFTVPFHLKINLQLHIINRGSPSSNNLLIFSFAIPKSLCRLSMISLSRISRICISAQVIKYCTFISELQPLSLGYLFQCSTSSTLVTDTDGQGKRAKKNKDNENTRKNNNHGKQLCRELKTVK